MNANDRPIGIFDSGVGGLTVAKVAILGWGVDTQDVVPYLLKKGAKLTVFDRKEKVDKGNWGDKGYQGKIEWRLGEEDFGDLTKFDLIIRSPGVYRFRPEITAAEKAGAKISSKTKLFFNLCFSRIIGVTGTKGKGTTATLIYEMLKAAGKKVFLGGNIGSGVFGILEKLGKNDWVVLELSSFQLIDLHKSPQIAVVLMVTTEHQDWHTSIKEYVNAKKNIVAHQKASDYAVINRDYENSMEIGKAATGKVVWVSREDIREIKEIRLKGEHNWENIAAAAAAARLAGVSEEVIKKVVTTFRGLEHRLEEVSTVNGVTFYNDSFSTTPETAIAAIKSFSEPIILIAGGSEKGSDFTELGKTIVEAGNVKAVILVGLMADRIQAAMTTCARGPLAHGVVKPKILRGCKNMAEIVKMAYNNAKPGDVVLLSPACASFDMFTNYKDRGEQFKQEIQKLKGCGTQAFCAKRTKSKSQKSPFDKLRILS